MESRIEVTDRLRAEGNWEEACRFREDEKNRLRAEGKSRREANEAAWEAMIAEFPPLEPPENPLTEPTEPPPVDGSAGASARETGGSDEAFDIDALVGPSEDIAPDLARDTLWVYANLERRGLEPEDAPNSGAWGLLRWSRRYRNAFFEKILPKAITAQAKQREDGGLTEDSRRQLDEIERFLKDVEAAFEAELLADTSTVVRRAVAGTLNDWQRRWGMELTDEPVASLMVRMAHSVQRCAAVLAKAGKEGS